MSVAALTGPEWEAVLKEGTKAMRLGPLDRRRITALVVVPAVLMLADVAANRTALKFLLLPPLGALTYLLFVNPAGVEMNARRVIAAPTATAAYAWTIASVLGYNAVSVGLVTAGTIAIMWLLNAPSVVPPLALALLTVLLHDQVRGQVDYLISVFVFTVVIYALYQLWLRLPLDSGQQQEPP